MKTNDNPMHPAQDPEKRLREAPRCMAMAKTTRFRCQGPAVKGWSVCRMHGAGGGAPSGPANGKWRHGNRTKQADSLRRMIAELNAGARKTAKALGGK